MGDTLENTGSSAEYRRTPHVDPEPQEVEQPSNQGREISSSEACYSQYLRGAVDSCLAQLKEPLFRVADTLRAIHEVNPFTSVVISERGGHAVGTFIADVLGFGQSDKVFLLHPERNPLRNQSAEFREGIEALHREGGTHPLIITEAIVHGVELRVMSEYAANPSRQIHPTFAAVYHGPELWKALEKGLLQRGRRDTTNAMLFDHPDQVTGRLSDGSTDIKQAVAARQILTVPSCQHPMRAVVIGASYPRLMEVNTTVEEVVNTIPLRTNFKKFVDYVLAERWVDEVHLEYEKFARAHGMHYAEEQFRKLCDGYDTRTLTQRDEAQR